MDDNEDSLAQQAWSKYVKTQYLDRLSIQHAHRAFLAGWKIGHEHGIDATLDVVTGEST